MSEKSKHTITRQSLVESINALPDDVLNELASFVDYLRYKTESHATNASSQHFLAAIAGLGSSTPSNGDAIPGWTNAEKSGEINPSVPAVTSVVSQKSDYGDTP